MADHQSEARALYLADGESRVAGGRDKSNGPHQLRFAISGQQPPSAKPISYPSSTCLFDVNSLTHAAHFYLFQFIQAPFTSCQVYSPPVQHHRFFLDAAETVSVETDSRHRALAFLPTANHLQSPIRRQSGAQMMNNPKVPSNL